MSEDVAELVTFTSKEAYVYAPIPAATSYGHRAELWNPDKWLQEVKVKVVTAGDRACVRLIDNEKGELFAECPLPHDGTPLTTAVEPVVDSSRYFVIKVVDRGSRKHAFIGVGFRERMDASDFSAALDDYRQYLRRKQAAEHMRQEFEKLAAVEQQSGSADGATTAAAAADLSLKPGQTIRLNLSTSLKRAESGKSSGSSSQQDSPQQQQHSPGSLKLPPPPTRCHSGSATLYKLHAPPAAAAGVGHAASCDVGLSQATTALAPGDRGSSSEGEDRQVVQPASLAGPVQDAALPQAAAAADVDAGAGTRPADHGDDDWGDFVS